MLDFDYLKDGITGERKTSSCVRIIRRVQEVCSRV